MQNAPAEVPEVSTVNPLAVWTEFGSSVLEAIDSHAVRWSPDDYSRFHEEMEELLAALKDQPTASNMLLAGGNAVRSIEQYQSDVQRSVDGCYQELHEIIGVLLSAVLSRQPGQDDAAGELRRMERTIRKTHSVHELREVKQRLETTLARLPQLSASPAGARSSSTASAAPLPAESLDPLTGLPNRAAAEKALLGLEPGPENAFLVVVYVQRMAHFNARLGDKLGNELLFLTTQRIASALLRPDDQMFRWRGPAFLALLRRPDTLVAMKREVKRVMATRFQFDLRGGAMLVTPALVAESFAAEPGAGTALIQSIEEFISLPTTCGF